MFQEVDKVRDQQPDRRAMHQELDKVRDQQPDRRAMHQELDKVRDQKPERKAKKRAMERIRSKRDDRKLKSHAYEQTDTRRRYLNARYKAKNVNIELSTTDTGFDVICSSCLQYKSRNLCKSIESLDERRRNKFLIKPCFLLKNRSEEHFFCQKEGYNC